MPAGAACPPAQVATGAQLLQAAAAGAQQVGDGAQQVGAGAGAQTGAAGAQQLGAGAPQDATTGAQQPRCLTRRTFTRRPQPSSQLLQPPQLLTTGAAQPQPELRENKPASADVAARSSTAAAVTIPRTIFISSEKHRVRISFEPPRNPSQGICRCEPFPMVSSGMSRRC